MNIQEIIKTIKTNESIGLSEKDITDFEKEKINRNTYEEANKVFSKKLKKNNHILEEMFNQLDEIRSLYNLSDEDIKILEGVRADLVTLNDDYQVLIEHTGNNTFAYSKLTKEIEGLSVRLANIEEKVDMILDSIGNMKDDEVRARQQLEEIKVILRDSKNKIREYNLPVIPQHYFVELKEAQVAIKEIIKELLKQKKDVLAKSSLEEQNVHNTQQAGRTFH